MTHQDEMNETDHSENGLKPETGLKHGQFYVYHKNKDGERTKVLVNAPTQEDIAEGWSIILPRARKDSTIHHFSVYLSQLPPHLWNRVQVDYTKSDSYREITDNIYKYSVRMSKHDNEVRRLYSLMQSTCLNMEEITQQFKALQSARVKGWVMIRAHRIMHPPKESC
jgi:hypothetical protein